MSKIDSAEKGYIMWRNVYILFVALYACGIVYNSAMPGAALDDIWMYYRLSQGEQVWHGLDFGVGRFFPLAGWNLNLVALFSTSPYAFMIGNACVFVITAWAFWRIGMALCAFSSSNYYGGGGVYICIAFIAFSLGVGYSQVIVSLCFPELTEIMFLLLFILMAFWYFESKKFIWLILALIFGNACIYLKEVAFILIGGFGFFHLFFALWNEKFRFNLLDKRVILFDVSCMLSGILFLGLYVIFSFNVERNYIELSPYFSPFRTMIISVLGTPVLSVMLPSVLCFRIYRLFKYREKLYPVVDSMGLIALAYWAAYLILGMSAFYYYAPTNILALFYAGYCINLYRKELKFTFAYVVLWITLGILLVSSIPSGINAFTMYKTQSKNTQDAFNFLAEYISKSPTKVNLYFDGFCRGQDKCHYAPFYNTLLWYLPLHYGFVDNYDIKSKEPNGKNFTINPNSPLTFFNSDEVSEPQSGDLVILHYASSKYMIPSDVQDIVAQYEVLFVSNNYPYYPLYSLMSLGAWGLKELNIQHSLSDIGNIFRLPSQVYVLRVP